MRLGQLRRKRQREGKREGQGRTRDGGTHARNVTVPAWLGRGLIFHAGLTRLLSLTETGGAQRTRRRQTSKGALRDRTVRHTPLKVVAVLCVLCAPPVSVRGRFASPPHPPSGPRSFPGIPVRPRTSARRQS